MPKLHIKFSHRCKITTLIVLCTCLALAPFEALTQDEKLKVEDLVARHLNAIGGAEARAAAKTRVAGGEIIAVNRIGTPVQLKGDGTIITSGSRIRFGMKFSAPTYVGEQVAYDGKRATTGSLAFGARSSLSLFIARDDLPLKEGLLGGVLSTAWPLLRLEEQRPRLEYKGTRKIKDRQLHALAYRPRQGGSGLEVTLYFDKETFRHVQTQYRSELTDRRYYFTEEFDDFRAVDGLMLPHNYKLALSGQIGETTVLIDWAFQVVGVSHKEPFNDQIFSIK